jgi:predicted ATPase
LSEPERKVLRRLSLLIGAFDLDAAQALACDEQVDAEQAADALDNLVAKSLISALPASRGTTRYRLPETTRVYAAKKLDENGERHATARRHAGHFARFLHSASGGRIDFPHDSRPPSMNDYLGNVRAALAWCFTDSEHAGAQSMGADRARLCIDLTAASVPLFLELSLLNECYRWATQALALLDEATRGSRREMVLQEARAVSAMWTRGNADDVRAAIVRGLEIAQQHTARASILRLLVGLQMFLLRVGAFRASRGVAEELATVAPSYADESYAIVADWLRGACEHFLGDQAAARRHLEAGFSRVGARDLALFGLDCRVRALVPYARMSWVAGSLDRAAEIARQAIAEATRLSKPLNVCFSLLYTIPVFLWRGDYAVAHDMLEQLTAHPNWRALPSLHATAMALRGELLVRRGELDQGMTLLSAALQAARADRQNTLRARAACVLAEALTAVERPGQARSVVDEVFAEIPAGEEPLDLPELLRIKSSILLAGSNPDEGEAERCLLRSLECARRQSAASFELRSAMALARLRAQRGASEHAHESLAAVYNRFTEGYGTADLRAAKELLVAIPSK